MQCLRENKDNISACREQSKDYLACRMENNLMAEESWEKLGFKSDEKEIKNQKNIKFKKSHKKVMFTQQKMMAKSKNILIGCTGSVAAIKLPNIISELKSKDPSVNVSYFCYKKSTGCY